VDGAVVVWTDQYEVRKSIVASAAQPPNVMGLTKLSLVVSARRPVADLTLAGIQLAELQDQIAIATRGLRNQVLTAFFGEAGRLVPDEPGNCILIARQQQCLQPLLGKQACSRLKRQSFGIGKQRQVIGLAECAD
jgi:hypothetical protein